MVRELHLNFSPAAGVASARLYSNVCNYYVYVTTAKVGGAYVCEECAIEVCVKLS